MAAPMLTRGFCFPNAEEKLSSEYACLSVIEREISIALPPRYIGNEAEYISLILNTKLGKFDERLQCIPVSIRNTKRLGRIGIISGENPNIYFKVLTEFIAFQPIVASQLAAQIETLSPSHIGLLVHEWFNASVPRDKEAKNVGNVGVGDQVLIEVVRSVVNRKMLSLECKLLKILNKAAVEVNSNVAGTGTHKSFESDEENSNNEGGKNKRKRRNTGCSDSGIDHESLLDTSLSAEMLDKPSKKKRKKNRDAENVEDSNVEEVPEGSIQQSSPTNDNGVDVVEQTTLTSPSVVQSESVDGFKGVDVHEEAVEATPKHKKKKKKKDKELETQLDSTMMSNASLAMSQGVETSDGDGNKKKKKRKSSRRDVDLESELSAHDLTTSMDDVDVESTSAKKKKHKKQKHVGVE